MSFFGASKGRSSKAAAASTAPLSPIIKKKYLTAHDKSISVSEFTLDTEEDCDTSHHTTFDALSANLEGDSSIFNTDDDDIVSLKTPPNHHLKVLPIFEGPAEESSTPPPLATPVSSTSFDSQEEEWTSSSSSADGLPPTLKRSTWSEVSARDYPVRSANYLQNRKKIATEEAVMSLWAVDLVQTDEPFCMCKHPKERLQQSLRKGTAPEFCFAVNICLPAPQKSAKVKAAFYQFVAYFGVDDRSSLFDQNTPVGRLAHRFCHQDDTNDAFRNQTFKLIPKIVNGGGFLFRQAVGTKPVLLGQKVSQKYYRTQDYCEVLVDIASDPVAKRIVRMALGVATHLTIDLSFCLEGKTVETLPEQLLGGFRVQGLNFADDGQRYVSPVNQNHL